jgi:prepilin-type processing-associated H-X9-DG protein
MTLPPETLVRYLLDDLPALERAMVEQQLARDPQIVARLDRLRSVVRALESPSEQEPPPGLATRTLAAAFAARPEPALATPRRRLWSLASDPIFAVFRRADLLVAASIGFLAAGLLLGSVSRIRAERDILACQDRLRGLHAALGGYADTRGGRLPWVGTSAVPVASALGEELQRGGQLLHAGLASCPLSTEPAPFAYTLGYRDGGRFVGPEWKPGGLADSAVLAADDPRYPHSGRINVLFAGGHVRYSPTGRASVLGDDDIYHNDAGFVQAGLHAHDAALGTGRAVP